MTVSPYTEKNERITHIRLIKENEGIIGLPEVKTDADFPCSPAPESRYFYETEREFVISIRHQILTDGAIVSIELTFPAPVKIDAVILENHTVHFIEKDNSVFLNIEISGLFGRCRSLDAHTLIRTPGLTLRLEQNDYLRRTGPYRSEWYPDVEIRATRAYMFAARKIAAELALPEYLNKNNLGYLFILGFETCNTIHGDYPPHWHFIYRWPCHAGSQAPHIYVDKTGKMIQNKVSIDCLRVFSKEIANDEWYHFITPEGDDLLSLLLDNDGRLYFAVPGVSVLHSIGRYVDGKGCPIYRDNALTGWMNAEDRLEEAKFIATFCGEQNTREEIVYERNTGEFISRSLITLGS